MTEHMSDTPFLRMNILSVVPEDERTSAFDLCNAVGQLDDYAEEFFDLVALFDHSGALVTSEMDKQHGMMSVDAVMIQQELDASLQFDWQSRTSNYRVNMRKIRRHSNWRMFAAKHGTIILYNFGKTLQALGAMLMQCPTIEPHVSREERKQTWATFNQLVPNFEYVRDAVAHQAEKTNTADKRKKDAVDRPGEIGKSIFEGNQTMISGHLDGRTFYSTDKKKIVQYDISQETGDALKAMAEIWISAIEEASIAIRQEIRNRAQRQT